MEQYSYLQFLEGETTAEAGLEVVALRRRVNDRAERASHRAREDLLRLGFAGVAARLLTAGCVREKKET